MATYTFDCANKIVQLLSTSTLDMQDLYSRWKDAVLDETMTGCTQAMRVVKEPLQGSTFIGPYYFTMNDWRIRPVDSAHELIVDGTVIQDETSTLSPFKVDDLTATVSIVRQIAVEVQTLELGTSGLTTAESNQLAKLDSINTSAGAVEANIKLVNDLSVDGAGTEADPWGPA